MPRSVLARLSLGCAVAALLGSPAVVRPHADVEELARVSDAEVRRHPDDPHAYLDRARVLSAARRWKGALAALREATAHGADRAEVRAIRGRLLLEAGRPRAAVREFDRVLARRPDAAGLVFERGRAYVALGQPERAAMDFRAAVATMPAPRPEHVIAWRDALLSTGRRAEAVAALDDGMRRVGRIASLQLAAIDLEVEIGRWESALGRLDELSTQSVNPHWIARRGEVLERAGRPAEARVEYVRALSLIETRIGPRRGQPFEELRVRLQTALVSTRGVRRQ